MSETLNRFCLQKKAYSTGTTAASVDKCPKSYPAELSTDAKQRRYQRDIEIDSDQPAEIASLSPRIDASLEQHNDNNGSENAIQQ